MKLSRNMAGKCLAWVLVWVLAVGILGVLPDRLIVQADTFPAPGATVVASADDTFGAVGVSAPWRLYSDGTLVVDGGFIDWTGANSPWHVYINIIKRIIFNEPITAGTSLRNLFRDLEHAENINGLNYINTSNVTDMVNIFRGASGLISLDLSEWDTSNVTNMSDMFWGASGLTNLDLSDWNTSNVIFMGSMFWGASGLTTLILSNWDTSNVIFMGSMFDGVSGLTNLNLSNWDTRNVINMNSMFLGASGLTNLDLSDWNTSNVTNMSNLFLGASGLTSLDLSGWDTSNVTNMSNMFYGASRLINLNLSNWNTSNVTSMSSMFSGASSLTFLDLSNWDTSNVTSMQSMFRDAIELTTLDLSAWNTGSVTWMNSMFWDTSNLSHLILGEHFRFIGTPALPNITPTAQFTDYWVNVGTGTPANPQGTHVFTSAQLMDFYATPGFADTWVWQRTDHNNQPNAFTVTVSGSTLPAGTGINQSGAGEHMPGSTVTIRAGSPPTAQNVFAGWTVWSAGTTPLLVNAHDTTTTFIMLDNPVTVHANWTGQVHISHASASWYPTGHTQANASHVRIIVHTNRYVNDIAVTTGNRNINMDINNRTLSGNTWIWSELFTRDDFANDVPIEIHAASRSVLSNIEHEARAVITPGVGGTTNQFNVHINNAPLVTSASPIIGQTGAGFHSMGSTITINAGERTGHTFAGWTMNPPGAVTLADASTATTNFIMPGNAVTLTANWMPVIAAENYVLIHISNSPPGGLITGQSGGGPVARESTANIVAGNREGYTFVGWTVYWWDSLVDILMPVATIVTPNFTMPHYFIDMCLFGDEYEVHLMAYWTPNQGGPDLPPPTTHPVTIQGSQHPAGTAPQQSGQGLHTPGNTVTIRAGFRDGYNFMGWTVNAGGTNALLADALTSVTTFLMPNHPVSITANWQRIVTHLPPDWWWPPPILTPAPTPAPTPQPTPGPTPTPSIDEGPPPSVPPGGLPGIGEPISPPLNRLPGVYNTASAVAAVENLMAQVLAGVYYAPEGYITDFAEAAIKQAASTEIGDRFAINFNSVTFLQDIADATRDAILMTLDNFGYHPNRPLQAAVAFLTTDFNDVEIRVEHSAVWTEVDRVWISTPYYAVAFTRSFIESNTNSPLYITLTSEVRDFLPRIPMQPLLPETPGAVSASTPRTTPAPTAAPASRATPQPLTEPDTEPPGWIFGTPWAGQTAVLGANTTTHRTITIGFSRPVNEAVRLAVIPNPGDPRSQVVRNLDGSSAPARYNPATGNIEARVSQSGTFVVVEHTADFNDIQNQSAEMQAAIRNLASHGVMQGATATEFRPNDPINRAQLAALVVRMLGIYNANATHNFIDVGSTDWFYTVVGTVTRQNLMPGTSATAFSPNQNTNREQLLSVSGRVLHSQMVFGLPANPSVFLLDFTDGDSVTAILQPDVALSARENIPLLRADGLLQPQGNITRGEAALIFYRVHQQLW